MDNKKAGTVRGYRDIEQKKFRKVMQLDEVGQYFFTIILNEDGTFDKYSFDVEGETSVRYEFFREQEKELRTLLREFRSWMKIENILLEYVEQHGGQALEKAIQGLQK